MNKGLALPLIAVFSVFLLQPAIAHAGKTNAVIYGKSYHLNSSRNFNEHNSGFGIEHEFGRRNVWGTIAMANGFRDSANNMSYMVGAGLHRRLFQSERPSGFYVDVGLNAFVMTREDVNGNKPFPGVLPSISLGTEKVGVNLTYIPRDAIESTLTERLDDPDLSGVLFLQLKVSMEQLLP